MCQYEYDGVMPQPTYVELISFLSRAGWNCEADFLAPEVDWWSFLTWRGRGKGAQIATRNYL